MEHYILAINVCSLLLLSTLLMFLTIRQRNITFEAKLSNMNNKKEDKMIRLNNV